jgi:pyruvate,water dikinase
VVPGHGRGQVLLALLLMLPVFGLRGLEPALRLRGLPLEPAGPAQEPGQAGRRGGREVDPVGSRLGRAQRTGIEGRSRRGDHEPVKAHRRQRQDAGQHVLEAADPLPHRGGPLIGVLLLRIQILLLAGLLPVPGLLPAFPRQLLLFRALRGQALLPVGSVTAAGHVCCAPDRGAYGPLSTPGIAFVAGPGSGGPKWCGSPLIRLAGYASVGGADVFSLLLAREGTMGTPRFPLPSEIADAPGAEDWRSMYPYFTRFQPEDDQRFWFYNSMHFPEPMPAFDTITAEVPYSAIGANTARVFVFPTTLGIEHRIVNGRVYITAIPVLDDAEIGRRAAIFGERASYYYENWDSLYEGWKARMRALIESIESVTVPSLPEFEDAAVVFEARGVAQNHYVRENFHKCIDLFSTMWHHHTEMLMLGYGAYVVFFQFCKQAWPEISDQTAARMVAGIDVIMYRPDDELRGLARLAVEAGVGDLFTEGCSPAAVLEALASRGEGGKRWLAAFEQAREPWFNVSTGDGFYHHHRSWADDLTVPFTALPRYVAQVRSGSLAARPTEELRAERDRIASSYRSLLTSDEERAAFDQMLGLCRRVFPFVEDHKFYCEHWFTSQFFGKIREFGALLARFGVLADAEDVFQLHHTEVDQALSDVMLAWAAGGPPLGAAHWQPIVAARKRMLLAMKDWSPPPALGPVPTALNDPAVRMLWGVTQERIEAWLSPSSDEIRGFGASSGVVEGPARVLTDVNQIGEIRDGEILICPVTAPSWAPVFGKIKAAVSDIGGSMSHAAIVAREYGMPAVVGTGDATKRISTGQLVRVDGDRGIVQVIE